MNARQYGHKTEFLCCVLSKIVHRGLIKKYVVIHLLHYLVRAMMVSKQHFFLGINGQKGLDLQLMITINPIWSIILVNPLLLAREPAWPRVSTAHGGCRLAALSGKIKRGLQLKGRELASSTPASLKGQVLSPPDLAAPDQLFFPNDLLNNYSQKHTTCFSLHPLRSLCDCYLRPRLISQAGCGFSGYFLLLPRAKPVL